MQTCASERLKTLADLQQKLDALKQEELTLAEKKNTITQTQTTVKTEQNELQSQHRRINSARQQRQDQQSPFNFLEQLPYLPSMETAELAMPTLADRIESYNRNCQKLKTIDDELGRLLGDLHRDGMSKFQTQDSSAQELEALFAYTLNLSQEQAAIERKARGDTDLDFHLGTG